MKTYKNLGIAKRLLLFILLFSSVATLLLTTIQLYSEYQKDIEAFQNRFVQIEDAFRDGITQSSWTVNREQTLLQLKGIRKFSGIEQVEIVLLNGETYMSLGQMPDKQAVTHELPLIYSDKTIENHHIGTLILTGSRAGINQRLWERVTTVVLSQAIKTFFVTIFILWLVYYLVTRHLLKIAEYVRLYDPEKDTVPLELERKPLDDELGVLSITINQTRLRIQSDYKALQERENSLHNAINLKQAAEILANYEKARALTTLSIIDDAILVTDDTGHIALVNTLACELFQIDESDFTGQTVHSIEQALSLGGKAFNLNKLSATLSTEYTKAYLIREGQSDIPVSITIRRIFPDNNSHQLNNCVIIICDLRQEQITKKMVYLSTHDYLTNLPNRYSFEQAIKKIPEVLETASYAALGMFDLDNFKIINDTCGHQAGDALLSQLATILSSQLPECATIYRLGGDEFGLLAHYENTSDIQKLGEKCLELVREYPFVWNHIRHSVTISIGISILQRDTLDAHDLLVEADAACYRAKAQGGNRVVIQYAEDTARHVDDIRSLNRLQLILQQPDLELFAQPIMPGSESAALAPRLELLLRHIDEQGQFYTPLNLIHAGERYGLITSIDRWVLQETFSHAETLISAGWHLNINISPQTLTNDRFLQLLEQNLLHYNFPPGSICLEITERNIVTNISHTRSIMQRLHEFGVIFALDDFGTGFASYGFIRHLPISIIKIDGGLIQNMLEDSTIHTMISSVVTMSESMGIPVAAEYVTSEKELDILQKIRVSYIQGEVMSLARPIEYFYHTTPAEVYTD